MARPSTRHQIVAAALRTFAEAGPEATIDAVARTAGVTKQGVLYHFADKAQLRQAMLAAVLDRFEQHITQVGSRPFGEQSVAERIRNYARAVATSAASPAEAALVAQLTTHPVAADAYSGWVKSHFEPEATTPPSLRARLAAAWLAATGLWSARATAPAPLEDEDMTEVLGVIEGLTAS